MALLIAFAGGAGAISLLAPSRWRENPIGFAGAAFVVGAGIISVLSFCLGFVIQGGLLRWIITITCLVLFVLGRVRCVKQGCKAERPSVNAVEVLLGILVIGQLWFVTWLSLCKSGLGWDGLFNWEAKALIAFRHNGAIPLGFYTSGYEITHVAYPVYLSLLQAWVYEWLGHIDQSMVKLIGPYLYLAAVLLLISSAKRAANSLYGSRLLLFCCSGWCPHTCWETGAYRQVMPTSPRSGVAVRLGSLGRALENEHVVCGASDRHKRNVPAIRQE